MGARDNASARFTSNQILLCRGGGIGRHVGFKIQWLCGRAGSIPALGTIFRSAAMPHTDRLTLQAYQSSLTPLIP